MSVVKVFIHEAEQARRLRIAAWRIEQMAGADETTIDAWSAAQIAWEVLFGEPVSDGVLRLALALGPLPAGERGA